jgi:predicted  nucleic acid-binding Zn-ribbon protein
LSDVARLSLKDIKGWLEDETGSIFIPVHAKAQKLLEDMRKPLESLTDASKTLLDNSAKEIEKRNMKIYGRARALNKLARLFLDRMHQIKAPDNVTYDSLNEFSRETQKSFAAIDTDVRNWFPRISPFFILDRRKFLAVFERAKWTLREVSNFVSKEYVKTKTLEETFLLIDKLQALEQQLESLKTRSARIAEEEASVEKEIAETRGKMTDLQTEGSVGQLSQTGSEIETLCSEVKHKLQHLQKPFIKLQSLATHGGGSGLTPDELSKLNQYVENPFEAFSTETSGHPLLRQILGKLDRSISEGKLKLKPEKVRKAEQAIDNITNRDSLASLHQKCIDATLRKARLSTSEEVATVQKNLATLQDRLEDMRRRKGVMETEESSIARARKETLEKIRIQKSDIEKNILSFLGKQVRID